MALTDHQAALTNLAIDMVLADEERFVMTDEERADYERLAVFFGQVATHPEAFPVRSNAARIKGIVKRAKGEAKPARKPKRHARLEKRQGRQKFLRANRRELAAQYNEAVAAMERDMKEAEEFQAEYDARIATQPKFQIKALDGRTILEEVPAESILRADGEPAFPEGYKIIVPHKISIPGA